MAIQISKKYKDDFRTKIIIAIIEIVIGILVFFLNIENLINGMTLIIGVILLVFGVINFCYSFEDSILGKYQKTLPIIQIILGILLIIYRGGMANIIIGSFLLILPLVRIICAKEKIKTLKNEIFNILLGLFVLFFGISEIISVVRYILGALIIIFALYNLYLAYLEYKKGRENDNVLDASYKEIK